MKISHIIEKYTECKTGKIRYSKKDDAEPHRLALAGSKPGFQYKTYKCRICDYWHVGSKRRHNNSLRKALTEIHNSCSGWKVIHES